MRAAATNRNPVVRGLHAGQAVLAPGVTAGAPMRPDLKRKIIEVCDRKIAQKGEGVGVSFYAFFANRNDDPARLMEAAEWWIRTHRLDHFEKAVKVRAMAEPGG